MKNGATEFIATAYGAGRQWQVVLSNSRNDRTLTFEAHSKAEALRLQNALQKTIGFVAEAIPSLRGEEK